MVAILNFSQVVSGCARAKMYSRYYFRCFRTILMIFISRSLSGLEHASNLVHQTFDTNEVEVFLRLYILLYAYDTLLLAESAEELPAALTAMFLYYNTWNLSVNHAKNKIVIFRKSNYPKEHVFMYHDKALDVDTDFSYLGMTFDQKGIFFSNLGLD